MVRLVRTPSLHTPVAPDQWVELVEHLPDKRFRGPWFESQSDLSSFLFSHYNSYPTIVHVIGSSHDNLKKNVLYKTLMWSVI